jgi:hypothetical protein
MACPDPEVLAAMAEDLLDPRERDGVLDHAADCDDCRRTLLSLQSEPPAVARVRPTARVRAAAPSRVPWAAAAALAISVAGLLLFASRTPAPPAEAPEARRVVPERIPDPSPSPAPLPAPENAAPLPVEPAPRPAPVAPKPAEEPVPVPLPAPVPPTPAPIEKPPTKATPPPTTTVAVVATLEGVEGEAFVLTSKGRVPANVGQAILPGEGVACDGVRGAALVSYPDRTRLELAAGAVVRDMVERDGTKGRRLFVEKGTVKAEVSRQPAGLAMTFETPHGEARVLGTTLALHVDPDPKKGTRLEVEEGKVELKNAAGRTVMVDSGHYAIVAAGTSPAVKALPKEEVLLALAFEDGKKPALVASGVVERGPGNRLCLMGEGEPGAGTTRVVFSDAERGLLSFQGDEVLSFDYWVDPQAGSVNFHFWNSTQGRTNEGEVPKLVMGKWAHATFRLADLVGPGGRMKEGDRLGNLYLQGTGGPGRKFYVDNVVITRARVLKLRSVETKK